MVELLKDYDMIIFCYTGKANVVVDSLSQMSMGTTSRVEEEKREIAINAHRLADWEYD